MNKKQALLEAIKTNQEEAPEIITEEAPQKKARKPKVKERPEDEITRTNITLPLGLHARAKAHCIRCRISFSAYLVSLLEKDLKEE